MNDLIKFEKVKIDDSIRIFLKFFQIFRHFLIEIKVRIFFFDKCFVVRFRRLYQLVDFQFNFISSTQARFAFFETVFEIQRFKHYQKSFFDDVSCHEFSVIVKKIQIDFEFF